MSDVLTARCPRCAAEHPADANFCVRCGLPLSGDEPAAPPAAAETGRFRTCPACGATNASSRQRCGRCKAGFDAEPLPPPVGAHPAGPAAADGAAEVVEPGPRAVFAIAVTVAALAILGVMATLLTGNGIGSFSGTAVPAEPDGDDVTLDVAAIRASSVRPSDGEGTSEPEQLLDGDPATAWREDASGDGVGEWVELELAGTPEVSRLVLWNGHQREGRFASAPRAARIRIELGERAFTADLLDVSGPQAVELPERVATSSVRLTVLSVVPGEGDLALSGLEVRGPPPTAADVQE